MSFFPSEVVLLTKDHNLIFDYDFLELDSTGYLLNDMLPMLNYDMGRYIDSVFINSHPYFVSNYYNNEYSNYLSAYILKIGENMGFNVQESYYQIFFSTLKKIHVLKYSDNQLDSLDYFILN